MGHYSDVYFGYTAEVGDKIERLFQKTIERLPEEVFETTDWGAYKSTSSYKSTTNPRPYPIWQVMSTKQTKWYQSYTPEGQINDMINIMVSNPDIYPEEEWFWVVIGESFPNDLADFVYHGNINESFMTFKTQVVDWGSEADNTSSYTDYKTRLQFEANMDLKPAHSIGTINYTHIEEYIYYYDLENRVEPVDEYFS